MKINSIVLNNFGSYEGETAFDTNAASGKNIVLIGGKNGAGKTTLFTAMRVCLYGYMSMGYKNFNAFYTRAITKLINNNAKRIKPAEASVIMHISLSNGQELDSYLLKREWVLADSLTEKFVVKKNGRDLTNEEIADFEKYILSLIPPELFNLYFFDGEKIADFFMNEGSNSRIKDAFLTLCGYDTFDIMRRNFKRISGGGTTSACALDEYWNAKQEEEVAQAEYAQLLSEMKLCEDAISTCDADIIALEKSYSQKGGISQDEWDQKIAQLREEEKKRELWNAMLKKWANDMVPFLMIRDNVASIKEQISRENNSLKYQNFREILESPGISALLEGKTQQVIQAAFDQYGSDTEQILDLSFEQSAILLSQINSILSFDVKKISKYKNAIKKSITLSASIRQELDNSNVSAVQEYMQRRADLLELKSKLLNDRVELEKRISEQKEKLQLLVATLNRTQSKLEAELKKASINDISAKAIIMLDKLQRVLYRQQITKVEDFFRNEIRTLMRKTNFIEDIRIDDEFNIFLYRSEDIKVTVLLDALSKGSEDHFVSVLGMKALEEMRRIANCQAIEGITMYCLTCSEESISLPIRIDQTSLSNGEKQIFIMALYHSLVQLGRHEIPFIIDTPFARIDTEHRRNISQHFFSKLNGQVFILSTNEEINSDHVTIMKDRIAATYMLENSDNKRTIVASNSYFEV